MPRRHRRSLPACGRALAAAACAALPCVAAAPPASATPRAPRVWVADEALRIRADATDTPASRGADNPTWRPGEPARLVALRGEVVAFQVVVEGGTEPVRGVSVDVAFPDGEPTSVSVARFLELYVDVRRRSRNERRPAESLGWTPSARPPDTEVSGSVPDALIPVELAPAWAPYPFDVGPRRNGAVWIDLDVGIAAPAGRFRGRASVESTSHGHLGAVDLELEIRDAELPYRPVSFFAYYGPYELSSRLGHVRPAEAQLWQLLHAHHVDALAPLVTPADVERLRPALDGSLFTAAHGYAGPGAGRPPAVIALGTYGAFGDPTEEALARVEAVAARLPEGADDVFVYAIDERCDSPRGPGWRRLLAASSLAPRVRAGHTCHLDPGEQDVDLVMMPANAFDRDAASAARAVGKQVWVYNGLLPRAGPMHLDAHFSSLTATAWIAASHDVGRWFLWETTFWNDDNRGGLGPVDPFANPESFHNQDGDAGLGDGMLLYPGTQLAPFEAHSAGYAGVFPSMRLKALRRGIQDAGYVALARAAAPERADAILRRAIPAALDAVRLDGATPWRTDGLGFVAARAKLRALVRDGARLDAAATRAVLVEAAAARPDRPVPRARALRRRHIALLAAVALVGLAGGAYRWRRRRRPAR